ncbi:cupin domain-containing protein [Halosegnis sp.]|uniref:cupin domain-containing protein n=1 Tax=Halosegnis sp. TaxID=2864959 RepID=UPI0035D4BC99
MERVRIDDVDNALQPAAVMRQLTEPLSCTDLAVNYYELAPGDSFAFACHAHEVQEEVFVVLAGTATWETADGSVEVGPGEAIRFGTDEFQRGWNRGDERVRALALGAPLAYGDQPKYADCPHCGGRQTVTFDALDDTEAVRTVCESCGGEVARWIRGPDGENQRVEP